MRGQAEVKRPRVVAGLILVSVLAALLALFQWTELLVAHAGGRPFCAINATLDCTTVWSSSFARGVQSTTLLPIAGWGLVWALGAFLAALRLLMSNLRGQPFRSEASAVRLFGVAGLFGSLLLGGMSAAIGALCVLCVGTYLLAVAFAVLAARIPTPLWPSRAELQKGVAWAFGLVLGVYLALLFPGVRTPSVADRSLAAIAAEPAPKAKTEGPRAQDAGVREAPAQGDAVSELVRRLRPDVQQLVANALDEYRRAKRPDTTRFTPRFMKGPADAPVHIVEFTDLRCTHCANLVGELAELESLVPPGALRVEPRQFPLDSTCNPKMQSSVTDPSGGRCAGARAMICLEGRSTYWETQRRIFAVHRELSKEKVLEIAGPAMGDRAKLEACMGSKETARRLTEDIDYAMAYEIEGTPLVVVNGREAAPLAPFLYALVLARGDANAPGWGGLPAPRATLGAR